MTTSPNIRSELQVRLEVLRKQILERLSYGNTFAHPSKAPVLIFIEDSNAKCLYNWTSVEWKELKYSGDFRKLLRDIEDICRLMLKTAEQGVKEKIEKCLSTIDMLFSEELYKKFDNYPIFQKLISEKKIDMDCFIMNTEFILTEDKLKAYGTIRSEDYNIRPSHMHEFLSSLIKTNKGRYHEFLKLRELIINYASKNSYILNEELPNYIGKHPKFPRNEMRGAPREEWKTFIKKIQDYEVGNEEYESLMEDAIKIFCNLPQEALSSKAFSRLREKNTEEHIKREDRINISLSDLCHFPPVRIYLTDDIENFHLYNITHHFERLFYGIYEQEADSKVIKISNIIFIPIKFFDFQVIGQIVVISPLKLNKSRIIRAVEIVYPEIQEAAKNDFYQSVISRCADPIMRGEGAEIEPDYLILGRSLRKILRYQGFMICKRHDGKWEIIHYTAHKQNDYNLTLLEFPASPTNSTHTTNINNLFPTLSNKSIEDAKTANIDALFKAFIPTHETPGSAIAMKFSEGEEEFGLLIFVEEDKNVIRDSYLAELYSIINYALKFIQPYKEIVRNQQKAAALLFEKQVLSHDFGAAMVEVKAMIKTLASETFIDNAKKAKLNDIYYLLVFIINLQLGALALTDRAERIETFLQNIQFELSSYDLYDELRNIQKIIFKEIKITDNHLETTFSRTLLHNALNILLSNAKAHGEGNIMISAQQEGNKITLTVTNKANTGSINSTQQGGIDNLRKLSGLVKDKMTLTVGNATNIDNEHKIQISFHAAGGVG